MYRKSQLIDKLLGIVVFFLLQAAVFVVAAAIITSVSGCDRPYLPWDAGTPWEFGGSESVAETPIVPDLSNRPVLEDVCEDNRATVELYRQYLASPKPWHSLPEVDARHRDAARHFIEEYEEACL